MSGVKGAAGVLLSCSRQGLSSRQQGLLQGEGLDHYSMLHGSRILNQPPLSLCDFEATTSLFGDIMFKDLKVKKPMRIQSQWQ